jgi:hypothetical protein
MDFTQSKSFGLQNLQNHQERPALGKQGFLTIFVIWFINSQSCHGIVWIFSPSRMKE